MPLGPLAARNPIAPLLVHVVHIEIRWIVDMHVAVQRLQAVFGHGKLPFFTASDHSFRFVTNNLPELRTLLGCAAGCQLIA